MQFLLTGARLFTGEFILEDHALLIDDGRIVDLLPSTALPQGTPETRLPERTLLAPGFIDMQVNGGGGVLFNATPTVEGALAIARAHRQFGTTALLPTVITDAPEVLFAAADAAAGAAVIPDSGVVGVHIEGPFFNPERKGAHPAEFLRRPDAALIDRFASLPAQFGPAFRVMLTLAPEIMEDADIMRLAAAGVILMGGHSGAGLERTQAAIAAGLHGFTHLFNAMPPLGNREPGIALAAMTDPSTVCGIIADGIHVHPALLRLALANKPPGHVVLVTDAMPPTGTDADSFMLLGRRIRRAEGRLVLEDGTLAGADIDMAHCVRNAVSLLGVAPEEALRMASLYPARFLRLDHARGRLAPGYRADLVALDEQLAVQSVWLGGVPHHQRR